jgi:protein TonB
MDGLGLATRTTPREARRGRVGGAFGASLALHGVFLALVILMLSVGPAPVPFEPPPIEATLVYLEQVPEPGGGGGGSPEPAPTPVEIPEPEPAEPLPVEAPEPEIVPDRPPPPRLLAPVRTDAAEILQGGGIDPLAPPRPGGGGRGRGLGPGDGPGLGPGTGGNQGGGPLRPGNGISGPFVIREVRPEYTADAMRAKIEGVVVLECVVQKDGSIGQVRVVRPLDNRYGLDLKAIEAARQWRFRPATKDGEPVDIYVTLELAFNLR